MTRSKALTMVTFINHSKLGFENCQILATAFSPSNVFESASRERSRSQVNQG